MSVLLHFSVSTGFSIKIQQRFCRIWENIGSLDLTDHKAIISDKSIVLHTNDKIESDFKSPT